MSNKLQQQVWNHAPYIGEKLLALLAIAEWANDEGFCAVSPDALAERVRITRDGALTMLGGFIAEGDLSLMLGGHRHGIPDIYQLFTQSWSAEPQPASVSKEGNMEMNNSREWLEKRGELEDQAIINIGPRNEE